MNRVQIIEHNGKPAYAVVPIQIWLRLCAAAEDAEDIADLKRFDREDDGVRIPVSVALTIADGAQPLRAWREHRGLTLQALADAAGVSKPYVSQIERGKRAGTTLTLKKLALALAVPLGALAA